jgi:hypothetical protein
MGSSDNHKALSSNPSITKRKWGTFKRESIRSAWWYMPITQQSGYRAGNLKLKAKASLGYIPRPCLKKKKKKLLLAPTLPSQDTSYYVRGAMFHASPFC